jgi:hypothetical protein
VTGLSVKQYKLGRELLKKYHRQIGRPVYQDSDSIITAGGKVGT